ncbi:N-acetyltransferase [Streptomyces spiroverticillatus]|uniref:Lysine N-acyltransferase MbtK n=1 Tax=Streptomyces finlayi TaxID=67296 RepID=A0A919C8X0_9ACTN|nr:GNAT family N-acetyltransferase [Streptomyces finlayi]GHA04323.1 N-acetyltransferase [Streptomyces spiroverticillatus]GHC88379.1 N-acetyltransferase [Streptomyces finlayi]
MPPIEASTDGGADPAPRSTSPADPGALGRPSDLGSPNDLGRPSDLARPSNEDTLELRLPDEFVARFGVAQEDDLLDSVADWPATATPVGKFRLQPVDPQADLPLLTRWMNDPAVAAFWELAGPEEVTAAHLRPQLDGDGRSVPCLGVLDGVPMSYWEIYRADLDPLARHYPARPHDTGVHLLLGDGADRGRGLGTALLRAVAGLVLDHRPTCSRVVAEPDVRNTPSVRAFLGAGFRRDADVDLPDKTAALMIRDRAPRPQA